MCTFLFHEQAPTAPEVGTCNFMAKLILMTFLLFLYFTEVLVDTIYVITKCCRLLLGYCPAVSDYCTGGLFDV